MCQLDYYGQHARTRKTRARAQKTLTTQYTYTMCLYPRFIKNRRYIKNKKNGGEVPFCYDERQLYVPIGCGKCIECRKQKANNWRVRLCEDIKAYNNGKFITLTFDNENLQKLCEELQTTDANTVATKAVRRFLERWRKKYGKSIRHWLITELGEDNDRIHLHGIIFTNVNTEEIAKLWSYGMIFVGTFCNEKTINYIVKYVTKIDIKHKGFEGTILCTAGIGNAFKTEANKNNYRYEERKEYYTLSNGYKVALPIYYRNYLYTEAERRELWSERLNKNTIFVRGIEIRNIDTPQGYETYKTALEEAQKENKAFGYGDLSKEWDKKTYEIDLKTLNPEKK